VVPALLRGRPTAPLCGAAQPNESGRQQLFDLAEVGFFEAGSRPGSDPQKARPGSTPESPGCLRQRGFLPWLFLPAALA